MSRSSPEASPRQAGAPGARRARGFTLLEMLVTAAIVATLAMVALPLAEMTLKRNREAALLTALREIRGALDAYKQASNEGRVLKEVEDSGYPKRLEQLVEGIEDATSAKKVRIYFLRRMPRDPMHRDPGVPAAETWGLRSYDSPPDDPQPGKDIYDVYSLSEGVGINGIPYKEW